uniref:Lymphocyte antigen 6 family member pge n=1 Tax=Salmo trutta TaxID=8032 RepID=A0A673VV90_SALTR
SLSLLFSLSLILSLSHSLSHSLSVSLSIISLSDEDCNRQGSKTCPSYSDACAVVRGHGSGVMKSCSYKSFCSQANSQGYRSPGVRVHCCFSDDCNVTGNVSKLEGSLSYLLLLLPLFLHWI